MRFQCQFVKVATDSKMVRKNAIMPIMKMIFAVIQPTHLRAVKQALTQIGVNRVTICDSQEFVERADRKPVHRGSRFQTNIRRKITLEVAVNDDFLEKTVATIESVARSGPRRDVGDGKIFVMNLDEAVSYEPETRGPGAI